MVVVVALNWTRSLVIASVRISVVFGTVLEFMVWDALRLPLKVHGDNCIMSK